MILPLSHHSTTKNDKSLIFFSSFTKFSLSLLGTVMILRIAPAFLVRCNSPPFFYPEEAMPTNVVALLNEENYTPVTNIVFFNMVVLPSR
jgi:hypothetical protein